MLTSKTARAVRTLALSIFASAIAQAGTITTIEGSITVTDVVTPIGGGLFQYNYTIADGTADLAVLDIAVSPGVTISGLTAPGGTAAYMTAYDSVLGLVSFIENNAIFPSTPLAGFIFDSPVGPGASTFGVTLFGGPTGSGSGVTGPIVPEPTSLMLCALGGAALLFWRKRLTASRLQ
jgi:PEP-CTERM motif